MSFSSTFTRTFSRAFIYVYDDRWVRRRKQVAVWTSYSSKELRLSQLLFLCIVYTLFRRYLLRLFSALDWSIHGLYLLLLCFPKCILRLYSELVNHRSEVSFVYISYYVQPIIYRTSQLANNLWLSYIVKMECSIALPLIRTVSILVKWHYKSFLLLLVSGLTFTYPFISENLRKKRWLTREGDSCGLTLGPPSTLPDTTAATDTSRNSWRGILDLDGDCKLKFNSCPGKKKNPVQSSPFSRQLAVNKASVECELMARLVLTSRNCCIGHWESKFSLTN